MEIKSKEDLINIIKAQDEKINSMSSRLDELSTLKEETTEKSETTENKEETTNDTTEEIDEKQVDEIEQMFSQD